MIVSYKDREEDRHRGLDAGADYYLAKGSFHDEALFDAVRRFDRRRLMNIGIVNDLPLAVEAMRRAIALRAEHRRTLGRDRTVHRRSTSASRNRRISC